MTSRSVPASVRYAVAIFLSSSLLFLIEPIAGKRLLPLLGGSAAVWTACLVFFQCALLLGYFVAHWLVTRLGARRQVAVYLTLLVLSLAQLWFSIQPTPSANAGHPILSVLWLLTILIGLPFVTLSATSPLLQAWYARTMHQETIVSGAAPAHPYRLFAVSNVGSLLALIVYPWFIEPALSLHAQAATLAVGFIVLVLVCGAIALATRELPLLPPPDAGTAATPSGPVVDRVMWVLLAACGSLLLSAVTNHLSQNVATIPLLWIMPLVLYLLTFVIAFAGERWRPRWLMLGLGLAGMGSAGYLIYQGDLFMPITRVVAIFCAALFGLCLYCHSELYRRRPPPSQLTTFYFFVAAGGALGAILVGIAAPTFLTGNYELGLGLVFASVLGIAATWDGGWVTRGFWAIVAGFMIYVSVGQIRTDRENDLFRTRNFYGTLNVTQVDDSDRHAIVRTLYHGVIEHGQEVFRQDLHDVPSTYYGHNSGVGLAMDYCCDDRPRRVGVIGLGSGTMAAYGKPGDVIRFYDINPAVEPIARHIFTHLRDSPAHIEIVNGDARVSLATEAPQHYDVIVLDAFSGDAIPVHLITTQALDLYRRHLAPGGIVAFHISNRYLNLGPVVQQLANRAGMGMVFISSSEDLPHDVFSSDWVLVTDNKAFLERDEVKSAGEPIKTLRHALRLWTDDYNSLLPILRLRDNDTTSQ